MTTSSNGRFILLDRDGVLNRDLPRSVHQPRDLELLPGAAEAVRRLNHLGYTVLVVTNQACVGRGEVSLSDLDAIHERLRALVGDAGGWIERIYVCPHRDEDDCACRKPRPGMLLRAQQDYQFNTAETWFVGDSLRDLAAAQAAGCRPALVRSGKEEALHAPESVPVFEDLNAFTRSLESP